MLIPSHLHIETINGICTARCTMCTFPSWTRKPTCMTAPTFEKILKKFLPYQDSLQFLSLFWCGEPLLDTGISLKVNMAKKLGFKSVGFASNCTELDYKKSRALLNAGLDTIICSVDGVTKETHESIRVGTDFDKVISNIKSFLKMRPRFGNTKVIVRFIRQKSNAHEWEEFKEIWEQLLSPTYGDAVISFNVIDCDGMVKEYDSKDVLSGIEVPCTCDEIYTRMSVFSSGEVALCCGDENGKFNLGNVLSEDPIEIYNNEIFTHYRRMIAEGRIKELDLCNTCTIPRSQKVKDKV